MNEKRQISNGFIFNGFIFSGMLLVLAVAVIWLGNSRGWWWFTAIVGFAIGVTIAGGRRKLTLAVLSGAVGWLLPLVWESRVSAIGSASSMLSGVMGFGTANGWIVWVLTGLYGVLLCLAPTWFGSSVRGLRRPRLDVH